MTPTIDSPTCQGIDRVGEFGANCVPRCVIVKFKNAASATSRLSALSTSTRTSTVYDRPVYAHFDIVRIDPNEDHEAIAQSLSWRNDVEYAQAVYRLYPQMVRNDPDYPLQWNLPLLDLRRAWDIQPAAGSAITVAVLDTIGQNTVVCGVLLTPTLVSVRICGLSCVADGNCLRVA